MKRYSIYLKIESYDDTIDAQFKAAKKQFLKGIEAMVAEKKIVLTKAQETNLAIELSIDEKYLEEVLSSFRKMDVVSIIDPEYRGTT